MWWQLDWQGCSWHTSCGGTHTAVVACGPGLFHLARPKHVDLMPISSLPYAIACLPPPPRPTSLLDSFRAAEERASRSERRSFKERSWEVGAEGQGAHSERSVLLSSEVSSEALNSLAPASISH